MERLRTATRPVVTLLFSLAVIAGFLLGKITSDQFIPVAVMVVGWWFSSRSGEKK